MPTVQLNATEHLYYEYEKPALSTGRTLVFVNPLTGSTGMWTSTITPALQQAGHGTFAYNFRGQGVGEEQSKSDPQTTLDEKQIINDLLRLLDETQPQRPVFVGLSIGGLYAARAWLAGAHAEGLVFINTLRKPSEKLSWINEALYRCAESSGLEIFKDMYAPFLFGETWAMNNRQNFLKPEPYTALPAESDLLNLIKNARDTDWNLPYEQLLLPVLSVSGLEDQVFYNSKDVAELFTRLPDAKRIDVEDAGHMIPVEKPDELINMLIAFVEEL